MKTTLTVKDRLRLRLGAAMSPGRPHAAARCRGVLAVARGEPVARVARALGVSRPTVYHWVRAYERGGLMALLSLRKPVH